MGRVDVACYPWASLPSPFPLGDGLTRRLAVAFAADVFDDVLYQLFQMIVVLHGSLDVADGIYNGRMISAAELCANRLERHLRDLTHYIDRNLSRCGDLAGTLAAADVLRRNPVNVCNLYDDLLYRDRRRRSECP